MGRLGLGVALGQQAAYANVVGPQTFLGSSLIAIWDAEASGSITENGNLVGSWRDTKGGLTPTQAISGSKPVYSATAFNGRPGLIVDGVDDYLELTGVGGLPIGAAPCEIWALVDQTSDSTITTARNVIAWGNDTNTSRRLRKTVASGVNRAQAVVGTSGAASIPANLAVDFTGRKLVRLIITGTTVAVQVDDNLTASVSAVPVTGSLNLRIGAQEGSGPTGYWQGVINAILVTQLLDTAKAAALQAWANARKGI